ncbi:MAG TPA: MFS transporter, partial [Actinomycetes bacterium]|nr:MFS transporter [Actinomycetes bacterium]
MEQGSEDRVGTDPRGNEGTRSATAVLRTSALRRVLTAYLAFGISEWATWIAILVWAFDNGGASEAGLVSVVQMVPATLVAPFAASLVERMRRDHALALGYVIQGGTRLAVGIALVSDAPTWVVFFTAALATTSIVMTRPVHHAIIPEIAETPAEITVGHSASSTIEGLSMFVGPILTGLMLEVYGPGSVFFLTSAAAIGSAVITQSLPLRRSFERETSGESIVKATASGIHELRHNAGALLLTLVVGAQWVVIGALDVLTVVFGIDVLDMGPSGPGILMSAVGLGGLIGAAATVVLIGRRKLSPAVAGGMLLTGVALIAVAFSVIPLVACVLLAVSGLGKAFVDVAGRTLLHRAVRHDILSRIFGVQESMVMGGVAVGAVIAPVLINHLDPGGAFVATGVFLPVVGLLALIQIRTLDSEALLPGPGFARLEAIPMFATLNQGTLEQLSRDLIPITVAPGIDVFEQGDAGDLLYIVDQGTVSIIRNNDEINTTPT